MVLHNEYNMNPYPGQVLEVSRRIGTRQKSHLYFVATLGQSTEQEGSVVMASPPGALIKDVRVDLISRHDKIKLLGALAGLGSAAITRLTKVNSTATCFRFATLRLGPAVLSDKGHGWQAVELPIEESYYDEKRACSFVDERKVLRDRIDRVTGKKDRDWSSEPPALQVVEFMADGAKAQEILGHVSEQKIQETEVFYASVRFRSPVHGTPQ